MPPHPNPLPRGEGMVCSLSLWERAGVRASDRTFSKRHHQRRTRHRIVNNHAAHAVDPRDQLWRHNLLRRALRHNLAVAQRNQMRRVAARLV